MTITRNINKAFAELVKNSDNYIERITFFKFEFFIVYNSKYLFMSDEYSI